MLYVATAKTLANISEIGGLSAADKVVVFYKENDTCKVGDIALFTNLPCNIRFFEMADRDDMLIQLGGLFVECDDVFSYLDSSIPVPKKYADRVSLDGKPGKRTAKRGSRKGAAAKPGTAEPKKSEKSESPESAGLSNAMNPPVDEMPAAKVGDVKEEPAKDVTDMACSGDASSKK